MYCISHINWVVSNSASSAILYILTNHSPVLEGTHYVYKHVHIVIQQIYIDTLRCMQTCTEYCRSPYTEYMLSLNIQVELSSIIRHDNRHPILLQHPIYDLYQEDEILPSLTPQEKLKLDPNYYPPFLYPQTRGWTSSSRQFSVSPNTSQR